MCLYSYDLKTKQDSTAKRELIKDKTSKEKGER